MKNKILEKYLEKLSNTESVGGFAIDSPHTGKLNPKITSSRVNNMDDDLSVINQLDKPNDYVILNDEDESIEEDEKNIKESVEHVNKTKRGRLLIDLDGVIHRYSKGWADGSIYDTPIEGAKKKIDALKNLFEIVIFTARLHPSSGDSKQQLEMITDWLRKYDIYYDLITYEKLPAFAYIDDNAIKFNNWNQTIVDLKMKLALEEPLVNLMD